MRILTTLLSLTLIFSAVLVNAEDSSCPAHRAAEAGYTPYDEFHSVMAPVWHTAWPEKDFDAMFAAAMKFEEKITAIMELKVEKGNKKRLESFAKYQQELADYVKKYSEAAKNKDKDLVYEILPKLHDSFEMGAASLLPYSFPELEGLRITLNIILENHLPKNNMDGITASTETTVKKTENLGSAEIPDDLKQFESDIKTKILELQELAKKMQDCCDKNDLKGYQTHIETMHANLQNMIESYL